MTNEIFRRQFVCNKQGFKKLDDKRQLRKQLKRHRDTRTGCGAMMQITLSKKLSMWVMDKFEDIHNHPLSITPSKVVKHRSYSKYHHSAACKRLVYTLNQKGLKPTQITRVVNAMKPGEEANITVKQCSSIISSERKNNVGLECYEIIKHFQEKAVSNVTRAKCLKVERVRDVEMRLEEMAIEIIRKSQNSLSMSRFSKRVIYRKQYLSTLETRLSIFINMLNLEI
ncbi:hypothetical protein RJ639_042832 [Escallonia herrerae]|uniref:FAR1 domain-containing protein n=1 Tax=Escallonia herrerae TaxID=1293975 RepID=A0AA89B3D8_9ASTE|nr:hypothetical protein RJ639_042832 [Escallonia herrerae]